MTEIEQAAREYVAAYREKMAREGEFAGRAAFYLWWEYMGSCERLNAAWDRLSALC